MDTLWISLGLRKVDSQGCLQPSPCSSGTSHPTAGHYPNPRPGEKWGDELSVAAGGSPVNTSGGWGQELSLVPLVQGWRMNRWPEMHAQVTLSSL